MTTQPEALRLAECLAEPEYTTLHQMRQAAAELRRLHALVSACEPFLKEDETPVQRIERERRDTDAMCRLYARERTLNAELLEALKEMHEVFKWTSHNEQEDEANKKARAAITKATGEKS